VPAPADRRFIARNKPRVAADSTPVGHIRDQRAQTEFDALTLVCTRALEHGSVGLTIYGYPELPISAPKLVSDRRFPSYANAVDVECPFVVGLAPNHLGTLKLEDLGVGSVLDPVALQLIENWQFGCSGIAHGVWGIVAAPRSAGKLHAIKYRAVRVDLLLRNGNDLHLKRDVDVIEKAVNEVSLGELDQATEQDRMIKENGGGTFSRKIPTRRYDVGIVNVKNGYDRLGRQIACDNLKRYDRSSATAD